MDRRIIFFPGTVATWTCASLQRDEHGMPKLAAGLQQKKPLWQKRPKQGVLFPNARLWLCMDRYGTVKSKSRVAMTGSRQMPKMPKMPGCPKRSDGRASRGTTLRKLQVPSPNVNRAPVFASYYAVPLPEPHAA